MVSLVALRAMAREYADRRCEKHPESKLAVIAGNGEVVVWCPRCRSKPEAFVRRST